MIVKIQKPIVTSGKEEFYLVYDRIQSVKFFSPVNDEINALLKNRPKAYFEVVMHKNGPLQIIDEVFEQPW